MTVETWKLGDFERPCGDERSRCSYCCKLPAAPPPLNKPAGVWCQHCDKGKGCRIYAERPEGCRTFMCLWKVMPDFPEALRPDQCKVIWQFTQDGRTAVATTEYPKALETRAQRELMENFRRVGVAVRVNIINGL